jgi:putative FmdB family regulatory protein
MPIYEYHCEKCNKTFERLQKISDASLCACPSCGSNSKRQMSRNSFQLKGAGWYVTDYKNSSSPRSGQEPSAPSPEASSSVTE